MNASLQTSKKSSRNMLLQTTHGFSLIELLVVIAIIGILSTIVLSSLGSARNKGNDAGIMGDLGSIATQFEVRYDPSATNQYGTLLTGTINNCLGAPYNEITSTSQPLKSAMEHALSLSGDKAKNYCSVTASTWMAAVPLKTDTSKAWCVDSLNISRKVDVSSLTGSLTACPL